MQLLVKFEKILYVGFRATLNFQNFKVALNPMSYVSRKQAAIPFTRVASRLIEAVTYSSPAQNPRLTQAAIYVISGLCET